MTADVAFPEGVPESFGLVSLPGLVVRSPWLFADLRQPRYVGIHLGAPTDARGPLVLDATFPDEHPSAWLDPIRAFGAVALVVTPEPFSSYPGVDEAWASSQVVLVGLMAKLDPSGVTV